MQTAIQSAWRLCKEGDKETLKTNYMGLIGEILGHLDF